ncbi:BRO family protein [Nocardia sp. NPDC051570]|uniref:BRO family protein n=1 Tax=Nocardia sp. NPDC051570 TaxID=3364324 RepID=UPI0037A1CA06
MTLDPAIVTARAEGDELSVALQAPTPFLFEGAAVRALVIDGTPWFVARDVCTILDLANVSMALRRLAPDEKGVNRIDTPGGAQDMAIVSESGLYALVLRSDKPRAVEFRRWVTGEVLPAIRRTGTYSVQPAPAGEQLLALAVIEANTLLAAKGQAIATLTDTIAENAPKVAYHDQYVADADLLKLRVVAAANGVGEAWLRELLTERGWIYAETETRWSDSKGGKETRRRYSAYAHKRNYFRPVEVHESPRFRGEVMHTLKVTPAGAEAIARLVAAAHAA